MTEPPLARLARRASADPSFLGWQLAAFAGARGWDDSALAAHLGCAPETLANVRLCGAIRPDHFRDDVTEVATKFGLDARRLAEAAKPILAPRVDQPDAAVPEGGCVLAARDRAEPS